MKDNIVMFSRGRGHGHAIPDMLIADEISRIAPQIAITFVSYATGANTFRHAKRDVIDLELTENNSFTETLLACEALLRREPPSLVIAHEEFAAIVAAKICNRKVVFVSAWLPPQGSIGADTLGVCDAAIVLGNPGLFPVPLGMKVAPVYVGPIIRAVQFTHRDRAVLRQDAGIDASALIIAVVPGGAASEREMPIADVVISAFLAIGGMDKRLIWISDKDYVLMCGKLAGLKGASAMEFIQPVERIIAMADVVITKGTRGITYDAAAVGVPTISISFGRNPIDDVIVPRIPTNISLNGKAVTAEILVGYIRAAAAGGIPRSDDIPSGRAARIAAEEIVAQLTGTVSRTKIDSLALT